jgi:GT2 family glycosyltransferase
MDGLVYIILVNWNGWRDTIECLESVLRNNYQHYKVVVCDNDSQDDSINNIISWAEGKIFLEDSGSEISRKYCSPPVDKPIRYVRYNRDEAERGGNDTNAQLILIQTGANLGFAGGNNVGMRYAMTRNDCAYVWLLNNDCVIDPDALCHLVQRTNEKPGAGMCGSTVIYYYNPDTVQALGGLRYLKWLGTGMCIGHGQKLGEYASIDCDRIEKKLNHILGASLFVSRGFLEKVGLMNEEYFLYYEEIDWATRAKGIYSLAYAPASIVYHKEGRSIGTTAKRINRSLTSDYYLFKNKLVFARKYFPWALPTVYLRVIAAMVTRALWGKWEHARMIAKIILS